MGTSEPPAVLIDVRAKTKVDAALFFAMAAGFFLWGLVERSAARTILTWSIMAIVMILIDRIAPILPRTATLAEAHDPPPDDAVRRSTGRYAAEAAGIATVLAAFYAALVVYLVTPGFLAGFLTAYCVSRLRALAVTNEIEHASGVRLSMRIQRSTWRAKGPTYYATSRLGL